MSHSVAEIREGRTPNPDMLCNSRVKFGAFYDYLDKEHAGSYDRIASGHYARVIRVPAVAVPAVRAVPAAVRDQRAAVQEQQTAVREQTIRGNTASSEEPRESGGDSASCSPSRSVVLPQGPTPLVARLVLTPDAIKDQTYFLAHLQPHQLARTLFPLGALTKQQVGAPAAPPVGPHTVPPGCTHQAAGRCTCSPTSWPAHCSPWGHSPSNR